MIRRALAVSLFAVAVLGACKKEEPRAAAPTASETKPADPNPTEPATPTAAPAARGSAAPAAGGLGSVAIPNAKTVTPTVLTGGQPTDEQLAQARDGGAKIVVNLRPAGEAGELANEAKTAGALGMKYVHLPIDGKTGDGLTKENAMKLAEILNTGEPAVIHCASGQRVAALMALKAFYADGATPEAALQVGKDNGLAKPELEKLVTDTIASGKN